MKEYQKNFFQSQAIHNAGIRPVTYENAPLLRRKVLPSTKVSFFKVKKSDKFDSKTTRLFSPKNFKRKNDDEQFKYKTISSLGC